MVQTISSEKYFVFGGKEDGIGEDGERDYELLNTTFCLDMKTKMTKEFEPEGELIPEPRDHVGVSYDQKYTRLLVFGG